MHIFFSCRMAQQFANDSGRPMLPSGNHVKVIVVSRRSRRAILIFSASPCAAAPLRRPPPPSPEFFRHQLLGHAASLPGALPGVGWDQCGPASPPTAPFETAGRPKHQPRRTGFHSWFKSATRRASIATHSRRPAGVSPGTPCSPTDRSATSPAAGAPPQIAG